MKWLRRRQLPVFIRSTSKQSNIAFPTSLSIWEKLSEHVLIFFFLTCKVVWTHHSYELVILKMHFPPLLTCSSMPNCYIIHRGNIGQTKGVFLPTENRP